MKTTDENYCEYFENLLSKVIEESKRISMRKNYLAIQLELPLLFKREKKSDELAKNKK